MRLAYVNTYYNTGSTSGGNAHVGQFIANAVALGHELWANPGNQHPDVKLLPAGRLARVKTLRSMDVIYTRLEYAPPGPARWTVSPYREVIGSPLIVWEFNTVPEFGLTLGQAQQSVAEAIATFKRYGQGCDLAICVSDALAHYVREHFGLQRVITVPNGSDPDLFRPDCPLARRMQSATPELKVVWMGSADLPWHNFELLRNTADYLWGYSKGREISFHIIGQGLTDFRDMPPNVNYYGPERYEQLPHWLSAMDVGLIAYRDGAGYYGSPLKLFDYMASGLAVVSTSQPQVREVFAELGQSDWMLREDDPKGLAELLLDLTQDRQRVKKQGAAARDLVVQKYNWKNLVACILSEIQLMIEERAS